MLPFIDQKSADSVKRQLCHLNKKLTADLQPVFTCQKLENVLKIQEQKPPLVNQQLVVYYYKCGSCYADYGPLHMSPVDRAVGFSNRDLGKRAGNFAIWTLHPGYREENNTMHFRDRTDITELLILFSSIMKLGIVLFDS